VPPRVVEPLAPVPREDDVPSEPDFRLLGEDDPSFLREIIESYLELTPPMITDLALHVRAQDRGALSRAAHKIKSSSAQVGLADFAKLCSSLQDSAPAGDMEQELPGHVEAIAKSFDRLRPLLERKAQSLDP
jgi:HPt (histidine-containing phosphotransfer) domain-containing protein